MIDYTTTNIRLEKSLLKTLKLKALQEEKSMSELVRDFIRWGLKTMEPKKEKKEPVTKITKDNPFYGLVNLIGDGPIDDASDHDRYLYGKSKKDWPS